MGRFRNRIIFLLALILGPTTYADCPSAIRKTGIDPLRVYLTELRQYSPLTPEMEIELAKRYANDPTGADGRAARAQMIEANLRRVVGVAMKYLVPGVDVMDTIQDGNIGLMKGVEGYDYRQKVRLGTYVKYAIKVSIRTGLCNHSRLVRQPAWLVSAKNKWKSAEEYLTQLNGAFPAEAQVMKYLSDSGTEEGNLILVRDAMRQRSPDSGDDEDYALRDFGERFLDPAASAEDAADEAEMHKVLATAVSGRWSGLNEREALVLRLRFGFEGEPQKSREIGARLGITREWARKLEVAALGKLLRAMEEGTLPSPDDYVETPEKILPARPRVDHRRAG